MPNVMIDMAATGRRIHEMRIAAGMTIKDVQNATGVTASAVTKWQRGAALPCIDTIVTLAALWNVKMDDIIVTMTVTQ